MRTERQGQCPTCNCVIDFPEFEELSTVECPECGACLIVPWEFGHYLLTEKEDIDNPYFEFFLGYCSKDDSKIKATLLKKDIGDYDKWLEYCKSEVSSLKTLEHPNVMPILDFGMCKGHFFIIEPWLEGFSIKEYDPNVVGELEVQSVMSFSKKVAQGLDSMHHKEFEHHNICPENIFVTADGEIKIINLFISRFSYEHDLKMKNFSFSVSPHYISPEKVEKHEEGKKGDVFSFGVFLYYFLTGEYPFKGENDDELRLARVKRKKAKDQVVPVSEYDEPRSIQYYRGNEIRTKVDNSVLKLLKPYPIQRPLAGEFIAELKLIDVEEDRKKTAEKRKNLLNLAETASIPAMDKLSPK